MSLQKLFNLTFLFISLIISLPSYAFPDVQDAIPGRELQLADTEILRQALLRFSQRLSSANNAFVKVQNQGAKLLIVTPRARYELSITPDLSQQNYDPQSTLTSKLIEDPEVLFIEQQIPLGLVRELDISKGSKLSEALWTTFAGDSFVLDPLAEKKRQALAFLRQDPLATQRQLETKLKSIRGFSRVKIADWLKEDAEFFADCEAIVKDKVANAKRTALLAFQEKPKAQPEEIAESIGLPASTISDWMQESPEFLALWEKIANAEERLREKQALQEKKEKALAAFRANPGAGKQGAAAAAGVFHQTITLWISEDPEFDEYWQEIATRHKFASVTHEKKLAALIVFDWDPTLTAGEIASMIGIARTLISNWKRDDAEFNRLWQETDIYGSEMKKKTAFRMLRKHPELTLKEIADRLDVPVSTLKMWIHRDPDAHSLRAWRARNKVKKPLNQLRVPSVNDGICARLNEEVKSEMPNG